jgi:hypothetical protein
MTLEDLIDHSSVLNTKLEQHSSLGVKQNLKNFASLFIEALHPEGSSFLSRSINRSISSLPQKRQLQR